MKKEKKHTKRGTKQKTWNIYIYKKKCKAHTQKKKQQQQETQKQTQKETMKENTRKKNMKYEIYIYIYTNEESQKTRK